MDLEKRYKLCILYTMYMTKTHKPVDDFVPVADLTVSLGVQALSLERDRIVQYLSAHPEKIDRLGGHLARTVAYLNAAEEAEQPLGQSK